MLPGVRSPGSGPAGPIVRDVLDRVAGFGPLQRYLDDPEIEEIWVNEPGRVFIARYGRSELTTTILGPGELADLVERMLRTSGRRIDMGTPSSTRRCPTAPGCGSSSPWPRDPQTGHHRRDARRRLHQIDRLRRTLQALVGPRQSRN